VSKQDITLKSRKEFLQDLVATKDELPVFKTNKCVELFNVAAGFDIETSSFYDGDSKAAIMYEWTFGIGYVKDGEFIKSITYGRTWQELFMFFTAVSVVLNLHDTRRLVVYVHNLPYEWQFMRKQFRWTKVFFLDARKPVYAINDMGIEFRCSLKLSGLSLANTARNLVKYKSEKLVGDLDYSLIRTPVTPLTEKELAYCRNDIDVILCYIQEKIESDGGITNIPLTNTGYVRRYCKKACFPEGEVYENEEFDETTDIECSGVSRIERSIRRWIHSCKRPQDRFGPQESGFLRLYEQLSRVYGGFSVPYEQGEISWGDN